MTHDEPLKTVRIITFSINHVHDTFMMLLSLTKAGGPIIPSTTPILCDEDILLIEEITICTLMGKFVHDTWFKVN
jgi:hypothetical protein